MHPPPALPAALPAGKSRKPLARTARLTHPGAALPALLDEVLVSLEAEAIGVVTHHTRQGEALVAIARGEWQRWSGMKFAVSLDQADLFSSRGEATLPDTASGHSRSPLTDSSPALRCLFHLPLRTKPGEVSAVWLGKVQRLKPASLPLLDSLPHMILRAMESSAAPLPSEDSLPALLDELSRSSPDLYQHSLRMLPLIQASASAAGLTEQETQMACWAALLHDIGEISIPREILDKPGPLEDSEWSVVKLHPGIGARMVPRIKSLIPVREIIHTHHEHYNGRGYPLGLAGDMIPAAARLLAIVDAFTAMTEDRPYRPAFPVKEAAARLLQAAGSQFDPAFIRAFLTVL